MSREIRASLATTCGCAQLRQSSSRLLLKVDHHAAVFVFKIVAMKQVGLVAGKIVRKVDRNPDRFTGQNQYRALPAGIAHHSRLAEARRR